MRAMSYKIEAEYVRVIIKPIHTGMVLLNVCVYVGNRIEFVLTDKFFHRRIYSCPILLF